MTEDRELLDLCRLVAELEEKTRDFDPSDSAASHKPLKFADTQLIGYRPHTRPGANTSFWKIARGVLYTCVLLFLGTLLWSYFDSRTPSAPGAEPAAGEAGAKTNPAATGAVSGTSSAGGGGGLTIPEAVRPSAASVPYVNRLRPPGVLESLASAGKQPELLSIDKLRLPPDGKPLHATVVLYALLDERTERRWRESKVLTPGAPASNPFLKSVTIKDAEGLDVLRDWHVEGVVVGK